MEWKFDLNGLANMQLPMMLDLDATKKKQRREVENGRRFASNSEASLFVPLVFYLFEQSVEVTFKKLYFPNLFQLTFENSLSKTPPPCLGRSTSMVHP